MKKYFKNFPVTLASIITTFFVATVLFTYAAWINPTQAPPGGNTDTPINVGPIPQTKLGSLTIDQSTPAPGLTVTGSASSGTGIQLTSATSGGRTHRIYAGLDGALHFLDVTAARERLIIFPNWLAINDGGGSNIGLRVSGRIRTGDAGNQGGVWVDSANTMFVGAVDANNIGFWGNGAGYGLSMNRTTGAVTATYLSVRPQNTASEGGEIQLLGAGSNPAIYLDNLGGAFRAYSGSSVFLQADSATVSAPFNLNVGGWLLANGIRAWLFGGTYQTTFGGSCYYGNQILGGPVASCSCPSGFNAMPLADMAGPGEPSSNSLRLYGCFR